MRQSELALLTPAVPLNGTTTMTSREIAELTGKQHKDVLYDIRNMLEQLGQTSAYFSANLPDSYGRPQVGFSLPKDLTITLVSGYSVPLRHRIVTRWMELGIDASRFGGMFTGDPWSLAMMPMSPSRHCVATWVA